MVDPHEKYLGVLYATAWWQRVTNACREAGEFLERHRPRQ
jgi:hypothetical protein